MKRIITLVIGMVYALAFTYAQEAPPYAFSYKAIITNSKGAIIANKTIGLKISILQDSNTGIPVYSETFTPTTSATGQIDIVIGRGTEVDLSSINWSTNKFFLLTEVDVKGGTAYQVMGVPTELLSVPYSLYSGESGNGFASIYTSTEKRPVLDQQGNMSIGEAVQPGWKLNVYGGAKAGWFLSHGDIALNGALWAKPGSSTFGTVISLNSKALAGGVDFWIASLAGNAYEGQGKLMIKPSGSHPADAFIMDKDGNVGLGLPDYTPDYRLDVFGDINFTGELFRNGNPFSVDYSTLTNKPAGNNIGDMQYWDGTNWVVIPIGNDNQVLKIINGIPTWSE